MRKSALVKFDQSAEEQTIHVAVCRVIPIEQGIKPSKGADQSFRVNTSLFGLWKDRSCDRRGLLAEQQYTHDHQCHQDDHDLPA
jgi:hypothetical protein